MTDASAGREDEEFRTTRDDALVRVADAAAAALAGDTDVVRELRYAVTAFARGARDAGHPPAYAIGELTRTLTEVLAGVTDVGDPSAAPPAEQLAPPVIDAVLKWCLTEYQDAAATSR